MEPIKRQVKLNLQHKPANVLQKEFVELRIIDVIRSKETVLEIMKAALEDPKNIQVELIVSDKLILASKIKELETGDDGLCSLSLKKRLL